MLAGEVKEVSHICDNDTMDSMIDRFGEKVDTEPVDEKHFWLKAEIADSHVFYAWVFGFGGKVEIESPKDIKKHIKKCWKQHWTKQ